HIPSGPVQTPAHAAETPSPFHCECAAPPPRASAPAPAPSHVPLIRRIAPALLSRSERASGVSSDCHGLLHRAAPALPSPGPVPKAPTLPRWCSATPSATGLLKMFHVEQSTAIRDKK